MAIADCPMSIAAAVKGSLWPGVCLAWEASPQLPRRGDGEAGNREKVEELAEDMSKCELPGYSPLEVERRRNLEDCGSLSVW